MNSLWGNNHTLMNICVDLAHGNRTRSCNSHGRTWASDVFDGVAKLPISKGTPGNVGIAIINHPFFDGVYHPFMVIRGMVCYCYTNIILTKQ